MKLKSKVVIGYCDIAAAGCRTLLGANLERFDMEFVKLKCKNADSLLPNVQEISGISNDERATVIQLNHKVENISALVINTEFGRVLIHEAVSEIIDLVRKSDVRDVIILSAIPTSLGNEYYKLVDQGKFSNRCTKCSITDQLLNNLLQFTKIEDFCTTVVTVDGKKSKLNSVPSTKDGSEQNIRQLHKFLSSEVSKDFDVDKSLCLVFNRPRSVTENDDIVDDIYL